MKLNPAKNVYTSETQATLKIYAIGVQSPRSHYQGISKELGDQFSSKVCSSQFCMWEAMMRLLVAALVILPGSCMVTLDLQEFRPTLAKTVILRQLTAYMKLDMLLNSEQ